jgi:uncharacterized protein DUF1488
MPLTRSTTPPLFDAWAVDFNMLAPTGLSVQCSVTCGALDALAKGAANATVNQLPAIFAQWRDAIESVASQKYDMGKQDQGMVIVGPDDMKAFIESCARTAH